MKSLTLYWLLYPDALRRAFLCTSFVCLIALFPNCFCFLSPEVDLLTKELEDFEMKKAAARAVTGVLASHPNSTDAHIINLSLTFHGQELLSDTKLELNSGRRYGLIGLNGIGEALGQWGGRYLSLAHMSLSKYLLSTDMYKARSLWYGWETRYAQGRGTSNTEQSRDKHHVSSCRQ